MQSDERYTLGELVQIASNEMRTPLTAITGYAMMLKKHYEGELTLSEDECKAMTESIFRAATGLQKMMNDWVRESPDAAQDSSVEVSTF